MAYTLFEKSSQDFLVNPKLRDDSSPVSEKLALAEQKASSTSYADILDFQAKSELESRFTALFNILSREKKNRDEFWAYCYYCASMLEIFHKAYYEEDQESKESDVEDSSIPSSAQEAEENKYQKIKRQIRERLEKKEKNKRDEEQEKKLIEYLYQAFLSAWHNFIDFPRHASQIRSAVVYANLTRLYWVFCRLTLIQGFTIAQNLDLIDKMNSILGSNTDINEIIKGLSVPNEVLSYFSVCLFFMRFLIDVGTLIKHRCMPTEKEKEATDKNRLMYEFYKRHCNFANDLVWGIVNLANIKQIAQLLGPTAMCFVPLFLAFDIGLLLYRVKLARDEYMLKKNQYEKEIKDFQTRADFSVEEKDAHSIMLKKQLRELEISWQTKKSTLYFSAGAATLLLIGFSATLVFTSSPLLTAAAVFACTVAVAMYISTNAYSKYKEKSLYLEALNLESHSSKEYVIAQREYQAAKKDFVSIMAKTTFIPLLLITTYAICWPAAIALTVLYIGYEFHHRHQRRMEEKNIAALKEQKENEPTSEVSDEPEASDEPNAGIIPTITWTAF